MNKFISDQLVVFTGRWQQDIGPNAFVRASNGIVYRLPVADLKPADIAPNWNKPTKAQQNASFGKRTSVPVIKGVPERNGFAEAFADIAKVRPIRPQ